MKTWFALLLKKWRVSHGQRSKPLTSLAKAYYPVHQVPFLDQLQKKAVVFTASSVKIFTASLSSIYAASSSCNLFFPRRASHHPCARAADQELRPNSLDLPYSQANRGQQPRGRSCSGACLSYPHPTWRKVAELCV